MSPRHGIEAMPEGHDAIRVRFDEGEPPAVAFGEQALPSALVSWAWCQLSALDSLLRVLSETRERGDDVGDVVAAVRSVLEPAINALVFSERRAHQLRPEQASPGGRKRGKRRRKGRAE